MTLSIATASAAGSAAGSTGEASYGWLGDIVVSIMETMDEIRRQVGVSFPGE